MDWNEVAARLRQGDDERTEFGRFRSFGEKDWLESVAAFANTDGGVVLLGVRDDGTIDGVPMPEHDVHERLTSILHSGRSGPVQARVRSHRAAEGLVFWIEVAAMRGPEPLRHRERVLVRRHRANVAPSGSELMDLYNSFGLVLTEERVVPGTSASDIDPEAYRRFLARRGIDLEATEPLPLEEELARAEILADNLDGRREATLYGLLCFGREPQRTPLTSRLFVQFSNYGGRDRGAEVLSTGEGRGRIDEQVRRSEDWLKSLGRSERYSGLEREDRWVVPLPALREALVNAVAHRDYALAGDTVLVDVFEDRVEVTSPGALPNHKTPESVRSGGPPRSRNEAMADFMVVSGLMERRGTGFPRMRRAMLAFNGTTPELTVSRDERWVRVTLLR